MNFFYDQASSKGTRPFSFSSSSSSSSSSQKILLPLSYQQHQRSWLNSSSTTNNNGEATELRMMDTAPPTASNHCDGDTTYSESQLDLGVDTTANPPVPAQLIEKEHMFDKVVTPSDVGKLNRLVIPKQYAEKYFPLDSSTNEKGLLLNFEDRNGKPWRFRYSYWNSSQSYVMTKGWSRFVKEKKLDAGDIVSFQRGVGELGKDRLFIDWRRRPDAPIDHLHPHFTHVPLTSHHFSNFHRSSTSIQYPTAAWSHPLLLQPQPPDHSRLQQSYPPHSYYGSSVGNNPNYYYRTDSFNDVSNTTVVNGNPCPTVYLRSGSSAQVLQMHRGSSSGVGGSGRPMVFDSVPVVQGKAAAKRLRLFGVNMDCPISDSDEIISDILSPNPAATAATYSHAPQFLSSSPNTLQFRTFNDTNPFQTAETNEESSDKGKTSMSLDLDI